MSEALSPYVGLETPIYGANYENTDFSLAPPPLDDPVIEGEDDQLSANVDLASYLVQVCVKEEGAAESGQSVASNPSGTQQVEAESVNDDGWHRCTVCPVMFTEKRMLLKHLRKEHPDSEQFEMMNEKPESGKEANTEIINLDDEDSPEETLDGSTTASQWICEVCLKSFSRQSDLKRHLMFKNDAKHREANLLSEPSFQCSVCPSHFERKRDLARHRRVKHQIFDPDTPKTTKASASRRDLARNRRVKHPIVDQDSAETTTASSSTSSASASISSAPRRSKASRIVPPLPLNPYPNLSTSSRSGNLITASDGTLFACTQCSGIFGLRSDLERHMISHTIPRSWACEVCKAVFGRKEHLTRHRQKLHQAMDPVIPEIHGIFDSLQASEPKIRKQPKAVVRSAKSAPKQSRTAPSNDKVMKPKKRLPRIIETVIPAKMVGPRPKNRAQLSKPAPRVPKQPKSDSKKTKKNEPSVPRMFPRPGHWSTGEGPPATPITAVPAEDGQVSCPLCTLPIACPPFLASHLTVHLLGRPWLCPHCPSTFETVKNLKGHCKRVHPDEEELTDDLAVLCKQAPSTEEPRRQLDCPLCPASSTFEMDLKMHLKAHTIASPWTCEVCGIPFVLLPTLEAHRKNIHQLTSQVPNLEKSGDVPLKHYYSCKKCLATFPRSKDLQKHRRLHTLKETFICEICGSYLPSQKGLGSHQRMVHQASNGTKRANPEVGALVDDESESANKKRRSDDGGDDETDVEEEEQLRGDDNACLNNQQLLEQLFEEAEDPVV